MKIYITGISKGLGKALTLQFLQQGHTVVGIGRSRAIDHPHFSFIQCDMEDLEAVKKIRFSAEGEACMLINNAGIIGTIERISEQTHSDIEQVMKVNTLAPMLLCQQFLKDTSSSKETTIINISSGAASRAIPSWAAYCSSKAALDRFSETVYLEELERKRNIRVYSVAPGVLDTEMQETIRSSSPDAFSSLQSFLKLKNDHELQSPELTAEKLIKLLSLPYEGKVICSLRDVQ
jgi:benzil reductase ((S)-benzoin forming)